MSNQVIEATTIVKLRHFEKVHKYWWQFWLPDYTITIYPMPWKKAELFLTSEAYDVDFGESDE